MFEVDAARGEEIQAPVEGVHLRVEIELRGGKQRAQMRRGLVRLAGDGEELFEQPALVGVEPGAGAQVRLLEKAFGDLAGRASAERRNVGDLQQVFDQRARAGLVGAVERRQHAGMIRRCRAWG